MGQHFFEGQHQVRSSSPVFPRTALHQAHTALLCTFTPQLLLVCCVGWRRWLHALCLHPPLGQQDHTGHGHILFSSLNSFGSSSYSLTFIFFDGSVLTATHQPHSESCYKLQFEDLSLTLHSKKDRVRRQGQAVSGNVAFPNSPATQQSKAGAAISTGMAAFKGASFSLGSLCEATYGSEPFF